MFLLSFSSILFHFPPLGFIMAMANIQKVLEVWQNDVLKGDPAALGIVVAVAIGIITIIAVILKVSRRSKLQDILLLGICDSGKTLLFSQLVFKSFKQSYTSIAPNSGSYVVPDKNKKVQILDLPGNERIRGQLLEKHKGLARAIIFVIDSGTLQKELKEVAEYLYTLFIDKVINSNGVPVLILCNKQDLTLSKGALVIKNQLEKEINTLRITKAAALQGVGDAGNNNSFLGLRNKDFTFEDIKSNVVEFGECSALGSDKSSNSPELDLVYKWLSKVA